MNKTISRVQVYFVHFFMMYNASVCKRIYRIKTIIPFGTMVHNAFSYAWEMVIIDYDIHPLNTVRSSSSFYHVAVPIAVAFAALLCIKIYLVNLLVCRNIKSHLVSEHTV